MADGKERIHVWSYDYLSHMQAIHSAHPIPEADVEKYAIKENEWRDVLTKGYGGGKKGGEAARRVIADFKKSHGSTSSLFWSKILRYEAPAPPPLAPAPAPAPETYTGLQRMSGDSELDAVIARDSDEHEEVAVGGPVVAEAMEVTGGEDQAIETWLTSGSVSYGQRIDGLGLPPFHTGLDSRYAKVSSWVRGTLGFSGCKYKGCPGCRAALRTWAYEQKRVGGDMPWAGQQGGEEGE